MKIDKDVQSDKVPIIVNSWAQKFVYNLAS